MLTVDKKTQSSGRKRWTPLAYLHLQMHILVEIYFLSLNTFVVFRHCHFLVLINFVCTFLYLGDNMTTMTTTYVEENTRIKFGIFPWGNYNSRCYSPRYKKVHTKLISTKKWQCLKTTKVLRLRKYISPLDDRTTPKQIEDMQRECERLKRNEE